MSAIRAEELIPLQRYAGGAMQGLRMRLCKGRYEIVSAGPNSEFGFIGSDPYKTQAYTGLVVPSAPSASIGNVRYLFVLARATFGTSERGARLVGIRQYAELVARIAASEGQPPITYRREIKSPLWHPPDGNISWHVMFVKARRDARNPQNQDALVYEDTPSPALLYETVTVAAGAPYTALTAYTPPNGGRPWGTPVAASLGNIHELRYRSRTDQAERTLDIPVPVPGDVVLFASVRQNSPSTNPAATTLSANQFAAISHEDQFLTAFNTVAQYGSIAGSLVFDENLGKDVP